MLALDDPRWHDLRTGYSRSARFLPLLRRMADDPHCGPAVVSEFARENHICHQGDVYETTVAVIPHFIHAAGQLGPRERADILALTGFEVLQLGVPLDVTPRLDPPADVVEAYHLAMPRAAELTAESLAGGWDEAKTLMLMGALTAFRGLRRLSGLLHRIEEGWVHCPVCKAEFEALVEWGGPWS